jgi:two-component system, cell cycle response regulator DivK
MAAPKVLVAEDYDDARDVMAFVLQSAGYEVLEARDGMEALVSARANNPAVIVMDMFMPNMDGLTATRALRDEPALRCIPVIAQTAQPSVVDGSRELFDAVLAKPCSPDLLIRTISDVLARQKMGTFLVS